MYLMIENENVSPVECFTMLGLSTSRGTDKIGQYGSGSKHGVLTLLRNNINPYIFLGEKELTFYSMPASIPGKEYNEIFYMYDGRKEKLSYCLEFGELDWKGVEMAIREFVSNAIDNGEYNINVENEKIGREGYTRVYIPWNTDVQKYVNELKWRFLHLDKKEGLEVIEKTTESPAKVYRRGVFIREIKSKKTSLFDYNSNDLNIDECRNLNDYSAMCSVSKIISNSELALSKIFYKILHKEDFWELDIYSMEGNKELWQKTWKEVCGNAVPCNSLLTEKLVRKGYIPVPCNYYWLEHLRKHGIKCDLDILGKVECATEIVETRKETIRAVKKYWRMLKYLEMTGGKRIPNIANFSGQMDGGSSTHGYYENNTVYISIDMATDSNVILEELAHHITGSVDNSRDFQEFAFRLAARAVAKVSIPNEI